MPGKWDGIEKEFNAEAGRRNNNASDHKIEAKN